jgi:hypothetical protein
MIYNLPLWKKQASNKLENACHHPSKLLNTPSAYLIEYLTNGFHIHSITSVLFSCQLLILLFAKVHVLLLTTLCTLNSICTVSRTVCRINDYFRAPNGCWSCVTECCFRVLDVSDILILSIHNPKGWTFYAKDSFISFYISHDSMFKNIWSQISFTVSCNRKNRYN